MLKILQQESLEQVQILKEREVELSEANQKKYILMRMLSHDIKNPISGIMGLVSILLEDDSLAEEEKNEMLELIKESSEKLLDLVKELLDKEVVGAGFGTLTTSEVNIVDVAQKVINANKQKAALKKIDIELVSVEEEILISIDQKKIKQIFNTLITNAIKFTLTEGTVKIKLKRHEKLLLIKIIDSGIGIPNAMLPNFLISSGREQQDNPRGILGVGLGLEEVRAYVEAHNGKIWVNSTEDIGTTFFIELPLGN